jgi:plastocyanin
MVTKACCLALLGLLTLSGLAAATDAEVQVGRQIAPNVHMNVFFPSNVVVNAGDTVVWKAGNPEPHSATEFPVGQGTFDSSPALDHTSPLFRKWFGPGGFVLPTQTFNRTFSQVGVFPYFCLLHSEEGMQGLIRVVNGTDTGLLPPSAAHANKTWLVDAGWGTGQTVVNAFAPADVTIEVGDTVQWENMASTEPHTVTGAPANPNAPPGPGNDFTWNSSPAFDFTEIPPDWFSGPRGALSLPAPGAPEEGGPPHTEYRKTFDRSGQYAYFCKVHPDMWGTVTVLEHATAMMNGTAGGSSSGSQAGKAAGSSAVPGAPAGLALVALGVIAAALRRRG